MCEECYSDENRITPLLNPLDCLDKPHSIYLWQLVDVAFVLNMTQRVGFQRWNFPFKSLEIAKLYLRTADYTTKSSCGIYEISE